jgi:hypothetical protein
MDNSIQFIYVQNLTAQRPITKLAQARKWEELEVRKYVK